MSFLLQVHSVPNTVVPFPNLVANDAHWENLNPKFEKLVDAEKNCVWAYVGGEQLYRLFDEVLGKEEKLEDYSSYYIRLDRRWIDAMDLASQKLFKNSWREQDQLFYKHFQRLVNKFYRSVLNGNRDFYMHPNY